ncbi:hypothetical protein Dimus_026781, partial [Dionaea muscipula]
MKNVVSRIGKRDTTSFMELTYMGHLLTRRLVNLPRVMLWRMAYVISIPSHELPYEDWLTRVFEAYHVPLDDKQGEEPKNYHYFEETFLTMCQLKTEQGVWWFGLISASRRRDQDEAPTENVQNEEVANEGQNNQGDFDWVQIKEEAALQGEQQAEKEVEVEDFGSGEKFFDAMDDVEDPASVTAPVPDVIAPAPAIPD